MTSYHAFNELHEDTTAAIIEVGFLDLDPRAAHPAPRPRSPGYCGWGDVLLEQ